MFPVGDFLRTRSTPFVNWTLLAINIAVFVYTIGLSTRVEGLLLGQPVSEVDRFFFDWGYVPACLGDFLGLRSGVTATELAAICPSGERELLQPLTSMFLHAGWAHVLGNMIFLWVFGDNVEDRLGHLRYLVFYLLAGLSAAAAQSILALDTTVPAVGASGAIAGVLAAYLVTYPRAVVQVVILPLVFLPFFVPAVVLIGFWFVTQLFSGLAELGSTTTTGSGVAWWAHVGGFLAGAALMILLRPSKHRSGPESFRKGT